MDDYRVGAQKIVMDRRLAAKIVEGARDTIPYNINIMDERGYIIAGTDQTRIGIFHEIAYQLINGTADKMEIDRVDDLIGTKPGINMVLKNGVQRFGVLGLTGEPDTVRPFASILKLAVETMIDYELQQQTYMRQMTKQGQLDSVILHGATLTSPNQKILDDMNISSEYYRLPVTVIVDDKLSSEAKKRVHDYMEGVIGAQDILTGWDGDALTVFIAFDHQEQKYKEYRTVAYEYVYQVLTALSERNVRARAYVGTFCHYVTRYFESYKRALWLSGLKVETDDNIVFFYDHLSEWAQTYLPINVLHDIFNIFSRNIDEATMAQMIKAESALESANYNLVNASKELFVHKNTLSLWLNRYRELMNIDPMRSSADREFFKYLICYNRSKGEK